MDRCNVKGIRKRHTTQNREKTGISASDAVCSKAESIIRHTEGHSYDRRPNLLAK